MENESSDPRIQDLCRWIRSMKLNLLPPKANVILYMAADAATRLRKGDHFITPLHLKDAEDILDAMETEKLSNGEVPALIQNVNITMACVLIPKKSSTMGARMDIMIDQFQALSGETGSCWSLNTRRRFCRGVKRID
jgi:hypothetical protein